MLPNFLIIGAPRAGTTWIASNIREHPDIYIPRIKEVHFFDRHYEKGLDYYQSFFLHAAGKKAIGEATPEYLYLEEIAPLIKQHLPHSKLIVSLRNPVDRLYSRYWNAKAKYPENRHLSFEEKIRQKPLFIQEGFYYDHLLRYYRYFPQDRILILFFDDIKKDPARLLKTIYEFLEVDSSFVSPLIERRVNAASVKGALAKSRLLSLVARGLARFRAIKSATFVDRVNEGKLPPMNPKTRAWLVNEVYREKNNLLGQLIGKDLSEWNKLHPPPA